MSFANNEGKSFREKLKNKEAELNQLRDDKLYIEVYQRRKNLGFLEMKGVTTEDIEEDTKAVLFDFKRTNLTSQGQC